jgi:hypothetical protein
MATGLLNGCPIEIEGRKGGSGEGGMLPPGEGKGAMTCARSAVPSRQRCAPGGGGWCRAAWSRGGGGPVGWAAAVGQPEETSRFLIYSN